MFNVPMPDKTFDELALTMDRRLPKNIEIQEYSRWRKHENEQRLTPEKPMVRLSDCLTGVAEKIALLIETQPNPRPRPTKVIKVCDRCKGTKFLRQNVPPTHPNFGRALRCPVCAAPWESYRKRLEKLWPVPTNTLLLGTVGIDLAGQPQLLNLAKKLGKLFECWPEGVMVVLDGGYGTAKSHSLAIIYKKAWESKRGAIYLESAQKLAAVFTKFERQKASLQIRSQAALQRFDAIAGEMIVEEESRLRLSRQRLIAELVAVPWLLVDEAHRYSRKGGNGWVERHFANLIDARLARGNSTVLAGNGMGKQGPLNNRLHPSILDRCTSEDCLWIDLNGMPSGRPRYGRNAGLWWK